MLISIKHLSDNLNRVHEFNMNDVVCTDWLVDYSDILDDSSEANELFRSFT